MSDEYRLMKRPPEVDGMRYKTWRYEIVPSGADDPVWVQRAADFWTLQAETYGLKFHDCIDIVVDYQNGIIISAVRIADVLPGRRTLDYVAPKARDRQHA